MLRACFLNPPGRGARAQGNGLGSRFLLIINTQEAVQISQEGNEAWLVLGLYWGCWHLSPFSVVGGMAHSAAPSGRPLMSLAGAQVVPGEV